MHNVKDRAAWPCLSFKILSMIKTLLLILMIFPILLSGQEYSNLIKKNKYNLIQTKYRIDYFKGYEPSMFAGLFYPSVSYRHFLKKRQIFFEFGMDLLSILYSNPDMGFSDLGKVIYREQGVLKPKIGSYLTVTPRLDIMVNGGLAYRHGQENIIVTVFYRPNGTYHAVTAPFRYNDFGLSASVELLYRYGKRWHLSLDAGGERYLIRKITTKEQLFASIGIGYAF